MPPTVPEPGSFAAPAHRLLLPAERTSLRAAAETLWS